jgi:hypothetical protein
MLDDQGAHNITVAHVESMIDAETYLAKNAVDEFFSTSDCPMHKDWKGCCGLAKSRRASPWWC